MKCKMKVVLLLMVALMIFLVVEAEQKERGDEELHFVDQIPHYDDGRINFKSIPTLDVDHEGNIYAFCNTSHNFVHKISPKGTLLKQFGGRGRGPGSLRMPYRIRVREGRLVIKGNNGISTFDLEGRFLHRFKPAKRVNSFDIKGGKIYMVMEGTRKLITVFTLKGKKVKAFGKRLKPNYSVFPGKGRDHVNICMNGGKIMCGYDRVFWFSKCFGDMRHYDYNGKLIQEESLVHLSEHWKFNAEENRNYFLKDGAAADENIRTIQVISDICHSNGKFHVLTLEKKEYDMVSILDRDTRKVLEEHRFYLPGDARGTGFTTLSFRVKKINGVARYLFSILKGEDREPLIGVYEREPRFLDEVWLRYDDTI